MIADLFTFLWASVYNLFTLLSGIVALLAELLRRYLGWEISNHWYGRIIVACLMVGMFSAWREERTEGKKKQDEINRLAQTNTGATNKMEELTGSLDRMRQENKQLEDTVASLENQIKPWRVGKRDEFIQALRGVESSVVSMECIKERDSIPFCEDLYNLMIDAGWTTQGPATSIGESWTGVQVVVKDQKAPPLGAVTLRDQLRLNRVPFRLIGNPEASDLKTAMFLVRVGHRP